MRMELVTLSLPNDRPDLSHRITSLPQIALMGCRYQFHTYVTGHSFCGSLILSYRSNYHPPTPRSSSPDFHTQSRRIIPMSLTGDLEEGRTKHGV